MEKLRIKDLVTIGVFTVIYFVVQGQMFIIYREWTPNQVPHD